MIAAIYCPGPSLRWHCNRPNEFSPPSWYDQTWAVNTAIKLVCGDWLAAGDAVFFAGLLGDHRPGVGVITMRDSVAAARAWAPGREIANWDAAPLIAEHKARGAPINWSLQSALCHAHARGAELVDVYGCDLAGTVDATGYAGENRNDDRWARERRDLDITIALLAEHGTTVRRITTS